MNRERLKSRVLERCAPDREELEKLRRLYNKVSEYISAEFNLETHFAGSASRSTCMAGDNDVDIFVKFSPEKGDEYLENKGLEVGKSVFEQFGGEFEVEYAEHPYTKGRIDGVEVEIVPCFDVGPEDIKSSVDRTPHHSNWLEENLDDEQREEVVMLKSFLRGKGIYGSSLKTRGFSGYLCEVLISEYGSFGNLVDRAVKWDRKEVIDPENHHQGSIPDDLQEKFDQDSLVVIDPVDPKRNVASVLSDENYARFVFSAWKFSRSPGLSHFEREEPDFTEFELKRELDSRGDIVIIEFERPDGVEDVVYPQMEKSLRSLQRVIEDHGFRIFESGFHVGEKTRIFFEMDAELPEVKQVRGPEVFHNQDHLEQFVSKYQDVFVRESRLWAKSHREFTDARELLKDRLDSPRDIGVPDRVAEKMENAVFGDPLDGDSEWLKYLAEKLGV